MFSYFNIRESHGFTRIEIEIRCGITTETLRRIEKELLFLG